MDSIESEWRTILRPVNVMEETYCSQLAHATWHLRQLNQVERDVIAASVRNRSFNGDSALRLMEWRRSAEITIQSALDHLEAHRRLRHQQGLSGPSTAGLATLAQTLASAYGANVRSEAASCR
jgi:hypothetical protein